MRQEFWREKVARERVEDILNAIRRFDEVNRPIPSEWAEELIDHLGAKETLLLIGPERAPISTVLRWFTDGPNHDWARREVPCIKAALRAEGRPFEMMADMALYTASELSGPQCRWSGNKAKSWMAWAMRQFGLEHRLTGY